MVKLYAVTCDGDVMDYRMAPNAKAAVADHMKETGVGRDEFGELEAEEVSADDMAGLRVPVPMADAIALRGGRRGLVAMGPA